jgi:5-formyltetrahydrofolate cyclo-ligase
MVRNEKQALRKHVLKVRKALDSVFHEQADKLICARLLELPELRSSQCVGAYVSDGTEPDLTVFFEKFMLSQGKLFLPRSGLHSGGLEYGMAQIDTLDNGLVNGAYGIPEPGKHCREADGDELNKMLWLVPGVAFDDQGRRLGRGKGFYDRLLNSGSGIKIGIFYECQKTDTVPVETHDQLLDVIITEERTYRTKQ